MLGNHGHGGKEVYLGCSGNAGSVVEKREVYCTEDHSYRTGSFVKNCTLMTL
jgi:hypothetical protein